MNWPTFSNKLQQEMIDHQSEVDISSIWNAIEPEVDKINGTHRSSGSSHLIWLAMIGGVILLSSFIYVFNQSAPVIKEEEKAGVTETLAQQQQEEKNNEAIMASNSNSNSTDQLSVINTTTVANSTNTESISVEASSIKEEEEEKEVAAYTPTVNEVDNNSTVVKTTVDKQTAQTIINTKATKTIDNNNQTIAANTSIVVDHSKEKASSLLPIADETSEDVLSLGRKKYSIISPLNSGAITRGLSIETASIAEYMLPVIDKEKMNEENEEEDKPRFVRSLNYALGLYGGISFANRNFSSDQGLNDPLFQLRERTESTLETVHGGIELSVGRVIGNNNSSLEFTTGAQYTRIAERVSQNETTTRTDSVEGIIRIVVFNGDSIPEYGNIPVTITETFERKYYNAYQLIDIPILLGYHHQFESLSLGFQAGAYVNVSLKTKGNILQTDQEVINIGNEQERVFKSSIGASYYFAMSGRYMLTDGLELTVAPFLHYYPNRFTVDNYALDQRYTLIGLKAGIRYKF